MSTVSVSVARQTLPTQLDRVEAGDEVAITRHGRVVAVLVHPTVLRTRRTREVWDGADRIGEMLERARSEPLHPPTLSRATAEELTAELQADRSAR